jgi:hypothetical protein
MQCSAALADAMSPAARSSLPFRSLLCKGHAGTYVLAGVVVARKQDGAANPNVPQSLTRHAPPAFAMLLLLT